MRARENSTCNLWFISTLPTPIRAPLFSVHALCIHPFISSSMLLARSSAPFYVFYMENEKVNIHAQRLEATGGGLWDV